MQGRWACVLEKILFFDVYREDFHLLCREKSGEIQLTISHKDNKLFVVVHSARYEISLNDIKVNLILFLL